MEEKNTAWKSEEEKKTTAIFLNKAHNYIESFVSYENHLQTYLLIKVWETQFM